MVKKEFDFSVIIPTHNRSEMLRTAIESVLEQRENTQIIVVDDASADDTFQVVEAMQQTHGDILYLKNETSLFANGSRKRGYEHAQGKYIVFLDDDDFYIESGFFRFAKEILEKHGNVAGVFARAKVLCDGVYSSVSSLGGAGIVDGKTYINGFPKTYPKPCSTVPAIFRKTALDASGIQGSYMVDDTCIYLNAIVNGDVYLTDWEVAAYRQHGTNISRRKFSNEFVLDTLREKLRIYKLAKKQGKLYNNRRWIFRHLLESVNFFIAASGKDPGMLLAMLVWIVIHGQGTQLWFAKWVISKFLPRK